MAGDTMTLIAFLAQRNPVFSTRVTVFWHTGLQYQVAQYPMGKSLMTQEIA